MRRKTGLRPPAIITDRPNAVLSLRFHLFYVRCCSVFKCFHCNTSVCPIISFSELNRVATCLGKSCYLEAYHLLS